ncbi:MAG: vanadium-dependent haloperoxidase [Acidobacteriota bacterium]|nr:vanadium-dependent haloperoxidase [Acidobacteriota bacterium]
MKSIDNDKKKKAPSPCPAGCEVGPWKITGGDKGEPRAAQSRIYRKDAADDEYNRSFDGPGIPVEHDCNGDEALYSGQNFIGSFTKGLPHHGLGTPHPGEVNHAAYCKLLTALGGAHQADFDAVNLGCPPNSRKLENPQGSYAFDMQGADSHSLRIPPAPTFSSQSEVADISENYWMALARDIPFLDFPPSAAHPLFAAAHSDLNRFSFYSPGDPEFFPTPLTADNIFRGYTSGDQKGPYLSQLLLHDVPYGSQSISARIRTLLPGIDFMTTFKEWLAIQNGCDVAQSNCDPVPRFIRSPRDLAQYVHVDATFNAFLNAALILFAGRPPARRCEAAAGLGVPLAEHLPYINPMAPMEEEAPSKVPNEIGMQTFGLQHITSLLLEVMNRALKAVWYQKWLVHRRLRPEEFSGRLDRHITGPGAPYNIDASYGTSPLFQSTGPFSIFLHNKHQNANKRSDPDHNKGTYLLPMGFAEGSPVHPSYGAGHATVAGACATVLKAFFPEDQLFVNPAIPNRTGSALVPYTGPDPITVRGELDKLASNISLGRNFGGMHWRSDHTVSLRLGEKIAISLLYDQCKLYNESYSCQFHRFSNTAIQIDRTKTVADLRTWMTTY